jgi:beta-mannosidase
MWTSSSVYNVTAAPAGASANTAAAVPAPPPPPPPGDEGSGDSEMAITVNGVRIFSRGGNLVPFELLEATVQPEYIKRTLQSVHDGSMNMIRVWGGGIWQDDLFYSECDRLGIMIFHDAMFSMRLYPHDAAFKDNVVAELSYQVGRLVHHPAIVLWDSSNENDGDPQFYYDTVLTTIAESDGSRPLWPASPSSGFATGVDTATGLPNGNPLTGRFQETLDTHMPYGYCEASYVTSSQLNRSTLFKSEFGQTSLPAFETLAPVLNESLGDFNVNSPIMLHRKHAGKDLVKPFESLFVNGGANSSGGQALSTSSASALQGSTATDFRRVIFLTQLAQTLCIKSYLEELRRGVHTFGALIWQLNDVWQASSWGSLDYGGRWVSRRFPVDTPPIHCLFSPELQWQPRGK